ncbi:PTS sugar transporter subunit IIB, partial [Escherichia coli]
MPNIVLSRIDERLIHGQVGVQWVGFAGANLVLVANDEVAEDPVQQNLNRPGFPGECFICELRLPDHRFRWK